MSSTRSNERRPRARFVQAAAVLAALGALLLIAVLLSTQSGGRGAYSNVEIFRTGFEMSDQKRHESFTVTNRGPRAVSVSFWWQTLTNGAWLPPEAELYRNPRHPIEPGESARFGIASDTAEPWRFVLLVQKNYPDGDFGDLLQALDRNLFHRRRFKTNSNPGHIGAFDTFLYAPGSPTNKVSAP